MGLNDSEIGSPQQNEAGFLPPQQNKLVAALLAPDEQRAGILSSSVEPLSDEQKQTLFAHIANPDWSDDDVIPVLEKVVPKYVLESALNAEAWAKGAFATVQTDPQMTSLAVYGARGEEAFNRSLRDTTEASAADMKTLVTQYPNALRFHRAMQKLHGRMETNNAAAKIKQYKVSTIGLGKRVYGNQSDYALAYINLEQQAREWQKSQPPAAPEAD